MIYDYPLITNEINIKPEPIFGEYRHYIGRIRKVFLKRDGEVQFEDSLTLDSEQVFWMLFDSDITETIQ